MAGRASRTCRHGDGDATRERDDKAPRGGLRRAQEPQNGTQEMARQGGADGEIHQRNERRHDALQRIPVVLDRQKSFHCTRSPRCAQG
jgi:hypothetical protein